MFRQAHRCEVCGFPSKSGTMYAGNFTCASCEQEQHREEIERAESEEYAELDRLSSYKFNY